MIVYVNLRTGQSETYKILPLEMGKHENNHFALPPTGHPKDAGFHSNVFCQKVAKKETKDTNCQLSKYLNIVFPQWSFN